MNHASQATIAQNIEQVRKHITDAERKYGRSPGSVQLLAVSKTRPAEDIRAAMTANQYHFGENYLQDALPKIESIQDALIHWHFIGPIQSNKTRQIANAFQWVHSVDRLKIAQRLSEQREATLPPLNICLQINSSGETSKSGIPPEEALVLAREVMQLPQLHLRGLMTIPRSCDDFEQQRQPFRLMQELKHQLEADGIALDDLSMGMSNDMEAAIAEGSTLVRIGTAIFGARQ